MPKKKQYEDAMSSVFDFIFTESKKPINKQKPVKVTGVDGTYEYADAIAAVLENPGKFVNKTTVDAFNDLVNPEIATVDLGPKVDLGPNEKVKFSLLNVKSVLENDMGFVDKAFAKLEADRKLGMLSWAGEQLSGIVAMTWAKKYGLDFETQNALFNMGSQDVLLDKRQAEKEKKLPAQATNAYYLEKVVKGEFGDYRNIPESVFKRSFGDEKGGQVYSELQKAFKLYDEKVRDRASAEDISKSISDLGKKNYQILYPVFESHNMAMKEAKARAEGKEELADKYKSAQIGVDLFAQKTLRDKYILKKKDELDTYSEQLKALLKSNSPTRDQDIKFVRTKIKDLNKELGLFKLQERANKLGKIDGMISSVKGVWEYTAGGQLVPAILTGDFFDDRKNSAFHNRLQPTEKAKGLSGVEFKAPKKGNSVLEDNYYQMMTDMYYLTPAAWVKTLYTGEGFAYGAFKSKQKLLKLLDKKGLKEAFKIEDLLGADGQEYIDYLTQILDQKDFNAISKFVKNNKRLENLAKRFSFLSRKRDEFSQKWLKGKIPTRIAEQVKGLRNKVGGWLLKKMKDGPGAKLIKDWMANGVFKVLIMGIKTSVKAYLAALTGGTSKLLDFLVDVVIDFAIKIGTKIAKPIVKLYFSLIIISVLTIVGLLVLGPSLIATFASSQYRHVAPNEVVLGQTDYKVPKDGGDGGGGTPFNGEPLPDGVSCLMGSSQQYDCTQGAGAPFSHGALPNAIDIGYVGYFYAPSFCGDGNCEIIENGDYPYCNGYAGGQVVFDAQYGGHTYRFKLVHVQMDPGLSVGDELGAGQIVARIMDHSETGSACSTGTHLHLEMWYDGAAVDPLSIMSEDSGGGGFGCSFDSCGN